MRVPILIHKDIVYDIIQKLLAISEYLLIHFAKFSVHRPARPPPVLSYVTYAIFSQKIQFRNPSKLTKVICAIPSWPLMPLKLSSFPLPPPPTSEPSAESVFLDEG